MRDQIFFDKMALASLFQDSELGRFFFEQSPSGILFADVDSGQFLEANPTICRMLGYSREELLALSVRDIHPLLTLSEVLTAFHRMVQGKQSALYATPCLRKDGSVLQANIRTVPWSVGGRKLLIGYFEDVTVQLEANLQASDRVRIYKEIAEAMDLNSLVSVTDDRGIIISANTRFCEISGYSEGELIGSSHSIINSGYHAPEFWWEFWSTIRSGNVWHGEIRNRKKNGEYYWVDSFIRPLRNNKGEITHYLSIRQDITGRKHAQYQLQLAEAQMRGILESQSTYVVRTDLLGNYTYANPKFLQDFGGLYGNHDINGKASLSSIMPYHHERVMKAVHFCIANPGRVIQVEIDKPKADGGVCTTLWDFVALTDASGNPSEIQCAGLDYTEKRRAEQELELTRKRLEETSELAQVGGWEIDLAANKVYWSSITKRMLEVPADYEPDMEKAAAFIKPGAGQSALQQAMKRAGEAGESADVELEVITASGREIWVRTILNIEQHDGSPVRIYGMFQDITERKRFEREILAAREEAIEANKAKSEFLANMSHEIRTPLNAVIGFTDLLKEANVDPLYKQYIVNANTSANILLEVINDILDFSKIEAGKLELDEIECDIYELASHAADIVKYLASQKGVELLLKITPEVPRFAVVDPIRVRQVLINLLSNAVKFTDRGEVELEIRFRELSPGEGEFTFAVRDTGIGMTEEQQARLFKAFTQADASITRRYGGTGLGLVISEGLLEKMHSRLQLQSRPGIGSTFFFAVTRPYRHGEAISREQISHFQHALVVDDNAANREIMRVILEKWGLKVKLAATGPDALAILQAHPDIQILISDYQMPDMDGLTLISNLRSRAGAGGKMPATILLHSSASDAIIFHSKRELQIDLTMTKPINADAMLRALVLLAQPASLSVSGQTQNHFGDGNAVKRKILVVEDVEMNMILIRNMIARLFPACEVIEARTGLIAIKRFLEKTPDLVLMDIHMPEMDGISTVSYLRQLENSGTEVPIIALTAATAAEEVEACRAAGMQEILAKPVRMIDLKEMLQRYLPG